MTFDEIKAKLTGKFPGVIRVDSADPQPFLVVDSAAWPRLAKYLRKTKSLAFDSLHCITGVDNSPDSDLEVRYNLFSMTNRHWLEIRLIAGRELPEVPSVADQWGIANWFEREVYDMYGIVFTSHPHLERILLPDDWEGWPLRKDYVTPEFYNGIKVPKEKE